MEASPNPSLKNSELPIVPWHSRLNVLNVSLTLFLLAVVFSASTLKGQERKLDYFANLKRFLGYFLPPDLSVLPATLTGLWETFQIAVLATCLAIALSLPLAIAGSRTMSPGWLVFLVRMLMNCIRTIPSLIWALMAVAVIGPVPAAGVVALTFYSMGYLGKFFSDAFESVDLDVAQGLRAIGADFVQSFQYGVLPEAKPLVWSSSLWMLEYNIRSAAIIGYVGAGGLGVQLHSYQEYSRWEKFATVLLCILVLVTILDFLGEWVRRQITKKISRPLAER